MVESSEKEVTSAWRHHLLSTDQTYEQLHYQSWKFIESFAYYHNALAANVWVPLDKNSINVKNEAIGRSNNHQKA